MRKSIVGVVLATVLMLGITVRVAPAASAHTLSHAYAVCTWQEAVTWGNEPNGISIKTYFSRHWWGSHQAECYYWTGYGVVRFLYDFISGAWVQVQCDMWCYT
jgi:hypothetical protein